MHLIIFWDYTTLAKAAALSHSIINIHRIRHIDSSAGTREQKVELEEVGEGSGFFGLYVDGKKYKSDYLLHIYYGENDVVVTADPYAFEPQISGDDLYLFAEGKHYQIYDKLGAHPMTINGVKGTYFAVWAPHARAVSVVGNFNMWDGRLHLIHWKYQEFMRYLFPE